jgi:hypothetical protein
LYHSILPSIVDAGAMSVWYFTNESFTISPITAPDITVETLNSLIAPFTNGLTKMGIKYNMYSAQYSSYLEDFDNMFSTIEVGIAQYGGWLIPRSVVETNNNHLTDVYRYITTTGGQFIGVGVNVSTAVVGDVYNAVLPAWRDVLIDTVITTPWDFYAPTSAMVALQDKMTYDYIPRLQAIAPQSGAYMNEVSSCQYDLPAPFLVMYMTNFHFSG